jgi:uncharacterized membrane protein (DUF485 family)
VSSGVVGLAIGLVLCFFGVGSLHLAVLGSGFALGWLVADLFDASTTTTVLVGLSSAVLAWILVTLVVRFAAFFVGAVAGGVIGARIFGLVVTGDNKVLLTVVFVLVAAGICGLLAARYRGRFLMWATALGGAGLAITGLSRIAPDTLGFLHHPDTALEGVLSTGAWLVLALLGRSTQLRLFPKALHAGAGER